MKDRKGVICPGGHYPGRKLSGCNYLVAIFLGGHCPGVVVRVVIVWRQIVWGEIILSGNCPGRLSGGSCPGGIVMFPFI